MREAMLNLVREEEGQALVEYGLIIALIAVLLIAALTGVKGGLNTVFTDIKSKLDGAVTP